MLLRSKGKRNNPRKMSKGFNKPEIFVDVRKLTLVEGEDGSHLGLDFGMGGR